jgi:hypothetical protein
VGVTLKKNSQPSLSEEWMEVLTELKDSWRTMWCERFDDSVAAEGVATKDYSTLFQNSSKKNLECPSQK